MAGPARWQYKCQSPACQKMPSLQCETSKSIAPMVQRLLLKVSHLSLSLSRDVAESSAVGFKLALGRAVCRVSSRPNFPRQACMESHANNVARADQGMCCMREGPLKHRADLWTTARKERPLN